MYELDKTIPQRYVGWLGDALQGDLGTSVRDGFRPVTEVLSERLPKTIMLATPAFILTALIAVALGVYSVGEAVLARGQRPHRVLLRRHLDADVLLRPAAPGRSGGSGGSSGRATHRSM